MPLLRLLAAVPERGGTDAIKLGFQSVELMCSDYMASLPVEQLRRCLEIAAMYANQQVLRPCHSWYCQAMFDCTQHFLRVPNGGSVSDFPHCRRI